MYLAVLLIEISIMVDRYVRAWYESRMSVQPFFLTLGNFKDKLRKWLIESIYNYYDFFTLKCVYVHT